MKRNILLFAFFILLAILFAFLAGLKNSAQIVIGNPESHPRKNGNWTINFDTKGKGSLWIIPQDQPTLDDIEFSYLACDGDKIIDVKSIDKTIVVPNWQCLGHGIAVFKVKTMGNHELAFNFADKTALAHNSSQTIYDLSASSSVSRFAYYGKDFAISVPVNTNRASWAIASGLPFTGSMYADVATQNGIFASTTDTATIFPQIAHDFIIRINETTSTVIQIDWTWVGKGTTNKEAAADNDLRLYVYNTSTGQWILGDSELDANCSSATCTMTYSTTTNLANYFDSNKGVRWLVQKYEQGHNCSSSPNTILCAKVQTSTPYNINCMPQANTEDLWNQCATTDGGGCGTGNCSGSSTTCGLYQDNAQHGICTTQCYGCKDDGSGCQGLTAAAGALGCGTPGDICTACASGSCVSLPDGTPCGKSDTCQSGVCTAPAGTCTTACGPGTHSCRNAGQQAACAGAGGTPDGNDASCLPTKFCCCGA